MDGQRSRSLIHDTRERVALYPAQNIIHMRLDSFESLISPKLNAQLASVFVSLSDQKPRTLLHIFETSSPITRLWLEIFLHRCDAVAVFFALVSAETTRLRRLILAKFRSCLSEDNTSRERLANFLRTSCPCTRADFRFSPCGNKMNRPPPNPKRLHSRTRERRGNHNSCIYRIIPRIWSRQVKSVQGGHGLHALLSSMRLPCLR